MANVGSLDRMIRFVLGVALIAAWFFPPVSGWGTIGYLVPLAGLVMVGTAILRFCPAYTLLGIRTCEISKP